MKLIVFLGNVGSSYDNTRHNVGFMLADYFNCDFKLEKKFKAYIFKGSNYIFCKPTTYMNLSGEAVLLIARYYDIAIDDILVVQDDMDLSLGSFKLKKKSSAGGHNGIKSLISSLNSDEFLRLKIGVGHPLDGDVISYVLGKFSKSEHILLVKNFAFYKELIECFISKDVSSVFALYSQVEHE